jgi:hypothetical protein
MRRPIAFAVLSLYVAGCAAPPESYEPPSPASVPAESAAVLSEPEPGPLESRLDPAERNFTPSQPIGEAQEPLVWAAVLAVACTIAAAWAADYGCKKGVLHDLCPPGTIITRTVRDTMVKSKTATVKIPCDVLETMICGSAAIGAGEIMRQLCGIL